MQVKFTHLCAVAASALALGTIAGLSATAASATIPDYIRQRWTNRPGRIVTGSAMPIASRRR